MELNRHFNGKQRSRAVRCSKFATHPCPLQLQLQDALQFCNASLCGILVQSENYSLDHTQLPSIIRASFMAGRLTFSLKTFSSSNNGSLSSFDSSN